MNNLFILETALEQIEAEISTDITKVKLLLDDPSIAPENSDAVYEVHEILHHLANHITAKETAETLLQKFKETKTDD